MLAPAPSPTRAVLSKPQALERLGFCPTMDTKSALRLLELNGIPYTRVALGGNGRATFFAAVEDVEAAIARGVKRFRTNKPKPGETKGAGLTDPYGIYAEIALLREEMREEFKRLHALFS